MASRTGPGRDRRARRHRTPDPAASRTARSGSPATAANPPGPVPSCFKSCRPELVLDQVLDAVRGQLPSVPGADPLGDLRPGPTSVHLGHHDLGIDTSGPQHGQPRW